ncbi:branched-chain amino acid transport system permease protein [Paenibacillus forsythiae]|uniref:Branched-chain amino acid transport system permease protein n=1 Tax=Paenibacillus forsythiae TaxID=365616 RepID=A0ABU3H5W7_9BACL|nr:branched-chain amino acid ABC transporter permease [Paenibacillus forsythiae]MDT3426220.1 branched-chain amino acid transport system permease protein [Paenibacillus forsythiae]
MFIQQLVNGLTIGSTYALVAIGFTLIFGVLELINFAHGSFYMVGAYFTLMLMLAMGGNFVLAFIISLALTGALGAMMDHFALRRIRERRATKDAALISTIGIATVIDHSVLEFFGSETKSFPAVLNLGKITVGNTIISYMQILIFAVAVILMGLLTFILYKTRIGKAMRAVSQNMDAAKLMGINVNFVISFTFLVASVLAAIAGTMVGMYYQAIEVTMGFAIGMKSFAAAVLGGISVLPGAMLGGLIIGVVEALGASISSGYRDAIAFAVLIIVLVFKPSGLLGKKHNNKV